MTAEERALKITEACARETSTDPFEIFDHLARTDFVNMHGPEHHVLDGACVLTAFYNAGGRIDLKDALEKLCTEGLKMPGAACGKWGVCGAVSSIGAALAIIDGTGPLSADESWGSHMRYTSGALGKLADIGGPRCCKRDAYLAMKSVVPYIKDRYGIVLGDSRIVCGFSGQNPQCLGERCPFNEANAE